MADTLHTSVDLHDQKYKKVRYDKKVSIERITPLKIHRGSNEMCLCVQTECVWTTVRKDSSWIRRARTVSLVTVPVVPAEGRGLKTVTPARTDSR